LQDLLEAHLGTVQPQIFDSYKFIAVSTVTNLGFKSDFIP
jgi:hypothetical protein